MGNISIRHIHLEQTMTMLLTSNRIFEVSWRILIAVLLGTPVIAQPITPVDSLANTSVECQKLIKIARTCVGERTDQIARILVESSYDVNRISTALEMEMANLLIGSKRYSIGLNYGRNTLCSREKYLDVYGPLHAIGCYWTATPTSMKVFCHGSGFTTTPVWDTVFDASNTLATKSWTPIVDSLIETLQDTLFVLHGRDMRELMLLFDSLHAWVPTVITESDGTVLIYVRPQLRLTVTLADDHIGALESKVPHVYDMLDDRRIRSIKFYRWPPKDAREYKEPVREIIYPEPITTGDK